MSLSAETLARQLAVLAKLNGHAIAPASEYFAKQAEAGPPPTREKKRQSRFAELFPQAECIEHEGSNCWRVTTWAPLSGERTAHGYACPVLHFGAPPTPAQLALLTGDSAWAELDPTRILYLDT